MALEFLNLDVEERRAVVRLNRPAARNALSKAMMRELTRCAREPAERTDVDVVPLTGSEVCFSSVADLRDARSWGDESLPLVARREIALQTLAMPAAAVRMSKESINALAAGLNHTSGCVAHDQIALAAASVESRAARVAALKPPA